MTRRVSLCAVLLLSLGAGGCAANDSDSDTGAETSAQDSDREPTSAELARLAGTLAKNAELGGARFELGVKQEGAAAETSFDGLVNWSADGEVVGSAAVAFDFGGKRPNESLQVWWRGGADPVIVVPTTEEAIATQRATGQVPYPYSAVAPQPDQIPLHLMLQFVNAGAAERIENPALLQQQGTVRVLRSETVAETECDVFAFGSNTTYWVGQEDGKLYRFEADSNMVGTVRIDYRNHGKQEVTFPSPDQVAPVAPSGPAPSQNIAP